MEQFSAEDDDAGENARLTYSLAGDVTAFRVDADSGKLYVKTALDRELKPRYEFSLAVTDHGMSQRP